MEEKKIKEELMEARIMEMMNRRFAYTDPKRYEESKNAVKVIQRRYAEFKVKNYYKKGKGNQK